MAIQPALLKSELSNCRETSITTGNGTMDLLGAIVGRISIVSAVGNGGTCVTYIEHQILDEWEYSICKVTAGSPDTLRRKQVIESSRGVGVGANFSAGTKNIYVNAAPRHQPHSATADPTTADDNDSTSGSFVKGSLWVNSSSARAYVLVSDADSAADWNEITNRAQGYTAGVDGVTVTFDLDTSKLWEVTLGGNRTLALSNESEADFAPFMICLRQDDPGSRTVTWFAGIEWAAQTAPTLTTTANRSDFFVFIRRGSGDYAGFVLGQDFAD